MIPSSKRVSFGFHRFSGLYLWAAVIVVFGLWTPHLFLTQVTLHSVASQQAIGGLLALAVLIPLASGHYDLSVGATIQLAAVLATSFQSKSHWPAWMAVLVTMGVAALVGVINGAIIVVLRVNSFIATLGTASVIAAVQTIIAGENQPFPVTSNAWQQFTQHTILGFQIIMLYLLLVAVVLWWILDHTPVGRYLYAIGANPESARLVGVRTGALTWLAVVGSAVVSGFAGVLYASQTGASLTFGSALLLPAFAGVFLGATQLHPGRPNVWGTLVAVFALATGVKGLQLVTGIQWLNDMFNGLALIVAVAFAVWAQRRKASPRYRRRRSGVTGSAPTVARAEDAATA